MCSLLLITASILLITSLPIDVELCDHDERSVVLKHANIHACIYSALVIKNSIIINQSTSSMDISINIIIINRVDIIPNKTEGFIPLKAQRDLKCISQNIPICSLITSAKKMDC
jgi:hypothetical protein